MGLEVFRKSMERLKATNDLALISSTRENLTRSGDKERAEIFNEIFAETPKPEKKK